MRDALCEITLRKLRLPLTRPYRLSYRTFTEFQPIIVHVRSSSGREGWGEGHISPGSSSETREGGWRFCREHSEMIIGKSARDASEFLTAAMGASKVAATAMITAIEMMEHDQRFMWNALLLFQWSLRFTRWSRAKSQTKSKTCWSRDFAPSRSKSATM